MTLVSKPCYYSSLLSNAALGKFNRYNPVLESVVTFTEELAYKQAKEADHLLAQGVYLGMDKCNTQW